MNWRLERACRIETIEVDGTLICKAELQDSAVKDLTIGLCLLSNDLADRVDLVDLGGKQVIKLSRYRASANGVARVSWDQNSAVLELAETELEALMYFCLRTVRDGVAEVDHIDIEADRARPNDPPVSFILKFPKATPPISAEEARRRLGL